MTADTSVLYGATAGYGYRPEHQFVISVGYGINDTNWFWICTLHRWRCEHHMKVFMTKYIHGDKQLELPDD